MSTSFPPSPTRSPFEPSPHDDGPRCPRCEGSDVRKVDFTWWGGVLGPRLLNHVKCQGCSYAYNSRTGQPNTTGIVVYSVIMGLIALAILALVASL